MDGPLYKMAIHFSLAVRFWWQNWTSKPDFNAIIKPNQLNSWYFDGSDPHKLIDLEIYAYLLTFRLVKMNFVDPIREGQNRHHRDSQILKEFLYIFPLRGITGENEE